MLKAQVLRRHFSLFNRVPYSAIARSAARDGHESVLIHRVRIGRPVFGRSRILGTFAIATAFWTLSRYVSVEVKADETASADGEGEEEDDDEYDKALLFLPTGLSRIRPQTFYKGSDPEWQEYKKLARDRPRLEKLRNELTVMIRNMVKTSPGWVAKIGEVDEKKGRVWLEVKFPDSPPPEFERPGIELTEDLEWRKATRPVADMHHHRLNSIMYPNAVANGIYQDVKRKAQLSWKSFRAQMGFGEQPAPETAQSLVQKVLANPTLPGAAVSGTPTTTTPSPPAPVAPDSKQSTQTASSVDSKENELGFVLPNPRNLTLDLTKFHEDFRKNHKRNMNLPRGSFSVFALIEVHGSKQKVTLNILATYDPKQCRYVAPLKVAVFNAIELKQQPKGGP